LEVYNGVVQTSVLRRTAASIAISIGIFAIWVNVDSHSIGTYPKVFYKVTGVGDTRANITYRDGTSDVAKKNVHLPFTAEVSGTQIAVIIARDNSTSVGTSLTCQIHVANVAPINNTYKGPDPDVECSA
jgi:hypothetical protein